MDTKAVILKHLDLETMRRVLVDDLGRIGVDRRYPEAMREMLSESPGATAKVTLEYLDVNEFRAMCGEMGISSKGGRWQVIDRILANQTPEMPAPSVAAQFPSKPPGVGTPSWFNFKRRCPRRIHGTHATGGIPQRPIPTLYAASCDIRIAARASRLI